MEQKSKTGKVLLIVGIALAVLVALSFIPWSRITNGHIKDFNLIGDIINAVDSINDSTDSEEIDPELLRAQQEAELNRQALVDAADTVVQDIRPNKLGDLVIIEDYTSGNHGLSHLKAALAAKRMARIAVVGDSYIEGDIMTQDLRSKLQQAYGGAGVGYMNMHSDMAGFRRSVKQGGSGWTTFLANKKCNYDFMALSEAYSKPSGTATSTYEGSSNLHGQDKWNSSQFLFIAPNNTTVSIKHAGEWRDYPVVGKAGVQSISVGGPTSEFAVKTSDQQLVALGVWLNDSTGVGVDCMSSRGFSGLTLNRINRQLCRQMAPFVDYDLIILEFGINAMSAKQTNYSVYESRMIEVINHVRQCYPNADILLMGIGDRGERQAGAVHSMKSCPYMVSAQRDAARRAHCLFWDTREAMGGEDAIVEWSSTGLANKDYIHMTHKGGDILATRLFNALQQALK